jgi:hypothetical protein
LIPSIAPTVTSLPRRADPHDPAPTRHQVIELPRVVAQFTEYLGPARTYPVVRFRFAQRYPTDRTADARDRV